MLKIIPAAILFLASQAAASTIYKCTEDGKPSYHDRPCGKTSIALAVQDTPAAAPEALEKLARERALLHKLEDERAKAEEKEARELARAEQATAAQRRRCHKLRLQSKWAEEDVAKAAARGRRGGDPDAARLKARRQAEALAVECPA